MPAPTMPDNVIMHYVAQVEDTGYKEAGRVDMAAQTKLDTFVLMQYLSQTDAYVNWWESVDNTTAQTSYSGYSSYEEFLGVFNGAAWFVVARSNPVGPLQSGSTAAESKRMRIAIFRCGPGGVNDVTVAAEWSGFWTVPSDGSAPYYGFSVSNSRFYGVVTATGRVLIAGTIPAATLSGTEAQYVQYRLFEAKVVNGVGIAELATPEALYNGVLTHNTYGASNIGLDTQGQTVVFGDDSQNTEGGFVPGTAYRSSSIPGDYTDIYVGELSIAHSGPTGEDGGFNFGTSGYVEPDGTRLLAEIEPPVPVWHSYWTLPGEDVLQLTEHYETTPEGWQERVGWKLERYTRAAALVSSQTFAESDFVALVDLGAPDGASINWSHVYEFAAAVAPYVRPAFWTGFGRTFELVGGADYIAPPPPPSDGYWTTDAGFYDPVGGPDYGDGPTGIWVVPAGTTFTAIEPGRLETERGSSSVYASVTVDSNYGPLAVRGIFGLTIQDGNDPVREGDYFDYYYNTESYYSPPDFTWSEGASVGYWETLKIEALAGTPADAELRITLHLGVQS